MINVELNICLLDLELFCPFELIKVNDMFDLTLQVKQKIVMINKINVGARALGASLFHDAA
jgi:hypothetical protein